MSGQRCSHRTPCVRPTHSCRFGRETVIGAVSSPSAVRGACSDVVREALPGAVRGTFAEAEMRVIIGLGLPGDGAAIYVTDPA
ncbi:MAG: hypothetical protein ACI970_001394 [Myxococcota bacterium]|jgi:hypothetical protein